MKAAHIIIILIGSLPFTVGVLGLYANYNFTKEATSQVEGTIIEMKANREKKGFTYTPIFRYVAENYVEYIDTSNYSGYPPAYSVGDKVQVFYDPKKPEVGRLEKTSDGIASICTNFLLMGAAIIALGFWAYKRDKKHKEEDEDDISPLL